MDMSGVRTTMLGPNAGIIHRPRLIGQQPQNPLTQSIEAHNSHLPKKNMSSLPTNNSASLTNSAPSPINQVQPSSVSPSLPKMAALTEPQIQQALLYMIKVSFRSFHS